MHTHECIHNSTCMRATEGEICGMEEGTSGHNAVVTLGVTATPAQHSVSDAPEVVPVCLRFLPWPGIWLDLKLLVY